MIRTLGTFLAGFTFAIGLGVAGMTQPAKVLGFLDVFGAWDPSLAFVMAGAVGTHLLLLRLWARRGDVAAPSTPLPPAEDSAASAVAAPLADGRLLGGATLFGLGWGLVGLCPGPALVALVSGLPAALVFFAAMVGGMLLYRWGPWLAARLRGERDAPLPAATAQQCG